ncbi:hypothetical protein SAMN05421797_1011485 [Maribacter ulvicola]|uniref:Uncharacterized protein n=1 Tax=Maribacter ulvicola TaxID=228959 RepID=A0A1N6S214_9FLAO|nr:hypothetical protein SAMN05421797_1011485 [Maribacter ulvicola]
MIKYNSINTIYLFISTGPYYIKLSAFIEVTLGYFITSGNRM